MAISGRSTGLLHSSTRNCANKQRAICARRPGHTLQTTALINEAYLRLIDAKDVHWQSRAHFFAIAANLMRRVLVDHARRRDAEKRGGAHIGLTLEDVVAIRRSLTLIY